MKKCDLKELDIRSKQYNQAVHSTKLSKEEMYKQSDVDFTVDLSFKIKEPQWLSCWIPSPGVRVQYHWVAPRSTQPFILARSMK